jgi:hypothetical protein
MFYRLLVLVFAFTKAGVGAIFQIAIAPSGALFGSMHGNVSGPVGRIAI